MLITTVVVLVCLWVRNHYRETKEKRRQEQLTTTKQTKDSAKTKGKGNGKADKTAVEYAGVGFIVNKYTMKAVKDFEQISGRIAKLTLQSHSNPIHIISTYAPQSGVGNTAKEREKSKRKSCLPHDDHRGCLHL